MQPTAGGCKSLIPIPETRSIIHPRAQRTFPVVAMCVNNEDCPGLYPVIRNSLVGLAPYLGKFRALNQIGEFHCHSLFSELRPLPVVVQ